MKSPNDLKYKILVKHRTKIDKQHKLFQNTHSPYDPFYDKFTSE